MSFCDMLNYRNISTKADISNRVISSFAFDTDLDSIWRNPYSHLNRLREAKCVLTPDYSVTPEMKMPAVIFNTYRNRWMGCFWQEFGVSVIPCVSWSTEETYPICFSGICEHSPVAVSTIGVTDKKMFEDGYAYMMERIKPDYVICYGKLLDGMTGDIISFDYEDAFQSRRADEVV